MIDWSQGEEIGVPAFSPENSFAQMILPEIFLFKKFCPNTFAQSYLLENTFARMISPKIFFT